MTNNHKILLIEDDQFISQAYQDGLKRAGFEVKAVADGSAVSATIDGFNPDLILLDLIMPGKDGFEVLDELSKHPDYRKIPIIVLSNLGQESDINKAHDLGAKDYLVKSGNSMKEVINKIIQQLNS